jgi:hypothetical protein
MRQGIVGDGGPRSSAAGSSDAIVRSLARKTRPKPTLISATAKARSRATAWSGVLTMFFAPRTSGRFPVVVCSARLVVRPSHHEPLCPQPTGSPALVMCRVALGISPEAGLAVPDGRGLEERMTCPVGPALGRPRSSGSHLNGSRWLGREPRACGSHRHLGIEAKASSLAGPNSDCAQVACMVVDRRAAYAEKACELPCVDQRAACGGGATQPLRDEVCQALELIIVQTDERICHGRTLSAWLSSHACSSVVGMSLRRPSLTSFTSGSMCWRQVSQLTPSASQASPTLSAKRGTARPGRPSSASVVGPVEALEGVIRGRLTRPDRSVHGRPEVRARSKLRRAGDADHPLASWPWAKLW